MVFGSHQENRLVEKNICKSSSFFNQVKALRRNPLIPDIPIPSIIYRNDLTTSLVVFYNNVVHTYVPRILARLTKLNIINWVLGWLGIRYEWLVMILLIII